MILVLMKVENLEDSTNNKMFITFLTRFRHFYTVAPLYYAYAHKRPDSYWLFRNLNSEKEDQKIRLIRSG